MIQYVSVPRSLDRAEPSGSAGTATEQPAVPLENPVAASTSADAGSLPPPSAPEPFWTMKSPDGSVYGPVPRAELETWLAEGRISSQCLLKPEGQSHWQAALSEFPQLAALRPRVTSPPPPLRPRVHRDPAVQIPRLTPAYENNGAAIMILGVIRPVPSMSACVFAGGSNLGIPGTQGHGGGTCWAAASLVDRHRLCGRAGRLRDQFSGHLFLFERPVKTARSTTWRLTIPGWPAGLAASLTVARQRFPRNVSTGFACFGKVDYLAT